MNTEQRKKKLKFRASHRGIKELDLFVGAFAEVHVEEMNDLALDEFEAILDVPDNIVLDWITGRSSPGKQELGPVLKQLLSFDYAARRAT